ncbi:unnamed protein product [Porites evermanni]|uniref:Uncharacterized protein n=1 Tax=Porites evermanni TaxID=104178 RepID=A0ABN8SHX9_9CNID|nr:unnamed protein product [Porites evermanni]
MKKRKEARQKAVEECRVLKAELYRNKRKIDRLQTKVSDSRIALADITNGAPNNQLQLGNNDTSARTRPPTILVDGKSNMPPRTVAKRRHETLTHASAIHGTSKNNPDPAFDGIRFEISVEQLTQLSVAACEHYLVNALFLCSSVNPTVWTIEHIIPAHTKDVHKKYGQGLGIVTMEGREAKHIALKKLSENTFFHRRWYEIFKYEFVMLVWLPEQGFDLSTFKHNGIYIPNRVFSDTRFCYCSLEKTDASDEKCSFCGDPIMALIQQSVEQGKVLPQIAHQVSLVP